MNSQLQFVKWVKAAHPQVYNAALQKVVRKSALGGLGDDLQSDISIDSSAYQIGNAETSALDSAVSSNSGGDSWSGIINSLANAVTSVAPVYVQSQAQLATIQANAQRAANGLPLLGQTSLLTGAGGSSSMLLIGALLLVGAFALTGRGSQKSTAE